MTVCSRCVDCLQIKLHEMGSIQEIAKKKEMEDILVAHREQYVVCVTTTTEDEKNRIWNYKSRKQEGWESGREFGWLYIQGY